MQARRAIQRGATCTVAAVEEVVSKRSVNRLISMVEASLWVVGGLLIAQSLQLLPKMPAGYAISYWIVVGGGGDHGKLRFVQGLHWSSERNKVLRMRRAR